MTRSAAPTSTLVFLLVMGCGDDGAVVDSAVPDTAVGDSNVSDATGDGAMDSTSPMDSSPPGDAMMDASVSCSDEMRDATSFGGGTGTVDDPWVVCTTEHLGNVASEPMGHFVLWTDLDGTDLPDDFQIPVLRGTFDGLGHVISNYRLAVSVGFLNEAGLFGVLGDDAVVRRLSLRNVEIDAGNGRAVGPIAGRSTGSIIDCHVLSGTVIGGGNVGGIVGEYRRALADEGRDVRGCSSAAVITGSPGASGIGGIVGSSTASNLRLEDVHFTGAIDSQGDDIGGIGGELGPSVIVEASSTGNLVGRTAIGGLVGTLVAGTIERSYALGVAQGLQEVGGLVGAAKSGNVTITDSYSRVDVRGFPAGSFGTASGHGGLVGVGTGGSSLLVERCYFAGSIIIDVGTSTDYWGGSLVAGSSSARMRDSFHAGAISVTARTANLAAIYLLERYGTVANVYYDAERTGVDRCWLNETTPSPDCTAVNVGGSTPSYFFDPRSPPLAAWDFSASGPWMMASGDYPTLR